MQPLVTVGIPVYNETLFVRESLSALLAQDYQSIQIIISDNASTDGTSTICQELALQHDHIDYHRFDDNQGPARNFNYVLQQATGKYFMWASGHDLWDKNYISSCIEQLEKNPGAILAVGCGNWIDESGNEFPRQYGWTDTRGMDVISRYFTILWGNMHPILGIIRREELQRCPISNTAGTDLIILTRLALQGDFIHAPNTTWSRREFRKEITYKDKLDRYKSNSYRLSSTFLKRLFPLAALPWELTKGVLSSHQHSWVKLIIILLLLPTFPVRYIAGKTKPS